MLNLAILHFVIPHSASNKHLFLYFILKFYIIHHSCFYNGICKFMLSNTSWIHLIFLFTCSLCKCVFFTKKFIIYLFYHKIVKHICISQLFKTDSRCFDIVLNCRLEFENRNLKKEKKEQAAYEAFIKSQKKERTE